MLLSVFLPGIFHSFPQNANLFVLFFFFIHKNLVSSKKVKIYRGREDKDNAHFRLTFDKKTEIKQRGESCLGAPPKMADVT